MSSVLDRSELEQSPLADLHLLANELGVDGFRRLRKPDLVDAILARQGGEEPAADVADAAVAAPVADAAADDDGPKRSRRGRRGGRGRRRDEEEGDSGRDSGRDRDRDRDEQPVAAAAAPAEERGRDRDREDKIAKGTVELLANGSGFLRLVADEESDD